MFHVPSSKQSFSILCEISFWCKISFFFVNRPELDRPAKELYSYELSSILDAALRSTNSQYDDPEILNNLDVRLMSNFEGDTGWDIFSLQYTIQGPLLTMLEVSMPKYLQLFKHLWRLKHMEYVLSAKIWKDQKCNAKVMFIVDYYLFFEWLLFNFIFVLLK